MTADPHRDPSPIDDPRDIFAARTLPAFVEVPAGAAGSGGRRTAEPHPMPGIADHRRAGCSPFPLDAIEID